MILSDSRFMTARRVAALALLLAAAPALFNSCKRRQAPRNMILITLDTQRADHVGAYGTNRASTPALDALAADGILYSNAYSLIPITLPSHASIFFSQPPHQVKNYNNGQVIKKQRNRPSLVNLFRREGFSTAAFVSLGVLDSDFNLDEGFMDYIDAFPPDRWYLSADEMNGKIVPWLEKHAGDKFFLWLHYSDPHDPYNPPGTPDDTKIYLNDEPLGSFCLGKYVSRTFVLNLRKGRNVLRLNVENPTEDNPDQFMARLDKLVFVPDYDQKNVIVDFPHGWFIRRAEGVFFFKNGATLDITCPDGPREIKVTLRGKLLLPITSVRDAYRREVEYMDDRIGELCRELKRLDLFDKTAIVVTGDHGEGLGEYKNDFGDDHVGHVHYLQNVYTKVPLIVKTPWTRGKKELRPEIVTLLDVAPTIAGIMGFKGFPGFQGRNLLDLKSGAETSVFQETYKPEAVQNRFALLEYPWHAIFCPDSSRYELYNLAQDPDETRNLDGKPTLPEKALKLKSRLEGKVRDILKSKEEIRVDGKNKEMLKALGYIGGDKK